MKAALSFLLRHPGAGRGLVLNKNSFAFLFWFWISTFVGMTRLPRRSAQEGMRYV
jgi:hypothetical protein